MKKITVLLDDDTLRMLEELKIKNGITHVFTIKKGIKLVWEEAQGNTRTTRDEERVGAPALDPLLK